MKHRDVVTALPNAPATIAAVASKPPAPVTQEELRRVGSLWDEAELLAADIRRRLEAGASFESGKLGVAIEGDAVTGPVSSDSISIGGLSIQPAEHHRAVLAEYPEFASETWI